MVEKYDLTNEQLGVLAPLYSFEKDLLIFPIYADGELLMYQGRYFGENVKHPKYLTYGAKDVLHILGKGGNAICVVEDIISAVKVSTVMPAMPLWGSHLTLKDVNRLAKMYEDLVIWLDNDKAKESIKLGQLYAPLFWSTKSVITKLDPKEYSNEQIRNELENVRTKMGGRKFYGVLPTLETLYHLACDELLVEEI